MIKYYKLLKEMPSHNVGDIIYSLDDKLYIWEKSPQYTLSIDVVENNINFFEPLIFNWIHNEPIWFIAMNGLIICENFHPSRHSSLVHYGNAFKSNNEAEIKNEKIKQILNGSTRKRI